MKLAKNHKYTTSPAKPRRCVTQDSCALPPVSLTPCFSGVLRGMRATVNRFNGFRAAGQASLPEARAGKPLKRLLVPRGSQNTPLKRGVNERLGRSQLRSSDIFSRFTSYVLPDTDHGKRSASAFLARPASRAFTMIEIALSLAIIGFALVAIIGILPLGMNVQKENREETIINQDATILMEAFRNGAKGSDDLTNYIISITNYTLDYNARGVPVGNSAHTWGYTYNGSTFDNGLNNPQFPLTNGYRIIGLLGTPKIFWFGERYASQFRSNHVVATFRSMSGPASEKAPQTNSIIQDLGLSYRVITDVSPFGTNFYDPLWLYRGPPLQTNSPDYIAKFNYSNVLRSLSLNLRDIRLTFRWPLLPNGDVGPGRQVYRTMVGGRQYATNDYDNAGRPLALTNLFFFEPRNYVQAQ
jgi:type II secretory pathway pseudopilin PulG